MKKLKLISKKVIFIISAVLVAGAGIFIYSYFNSKSVEAAWWDDTWKFRKAITLTDSAAETNKYATLSSYDASDTTKYQSDCGDIRFTDQNTKLLTYTVSSCGASTTFHINIPSILNGTQTIYIYYGNPSAADGFSSSDPYSACATCTFGSPASEEQSVGPLAYWKFDEGQGSTAYNSIKDVTTTGSTLNLGTGIDNACTVSSGSTDLSTSSCAGRGTADAVNFSSTANTAAAATSIVLTASSTGLTTGDEVLIINLQGTSGDNSNVGKYETKTISSITTTTNPNDTLNFSTGLTNGYDGTTQKIMVQRVPNYTTVSVSGGATLTTTAWNGTKGGVLFFRANGTITIAGTLDLKGKGFRGGSAGVGGGTICNVTHGGQGESTTGTGSLTYTANSAGGGGGGLSNACVSDAPGGGGGYGASGNTPSGGTGNKGQGGGTYGAAALTTLYLGSGGGGGGADWPGGNNGGIGGIAGGIAVVSANSITVSGTLRADGNNGGNASGLNRSHGGGGGSGGSLLLLTNSLTVSGTVSATYGTGGIGVSNFPYFGSTGGDGGSGRVAVYSNSISGTTTPSASTYAVNSSNNGTLQGSPTWTAEGQCVSGKCLKFDGTDDYISVGNTLSGVKTISFWVNPVSTTTNLIDFDGGTHYISASSGTISATGFTSPTIYVNGVQTTTLTANKWSHIEVTTGTSFNASAITLGKVSTNYLNGFLDEVKIYNYTRSAAQVKVDYNGLSSRTGSGIQIDSGSVAGMTKGALSNGLVGYWKMDESSGNAADSSGNSVTLTNNSSMAYGAGKYGNGITCDGTADYLNTASAINNIQTVSFWVYPASAANNYFINLINSSSYITINSSGVVSATGFTSPSIYVNGVLNGTVAAATWSEVTITTSTGINANAFAVGLTNDGSNHFCTNTSLIDEVRVYQRALTSAEISSLYNWAPGPVGYYNFEEKSGQTVNDTSGYGNSGTLGATSSVNTDDPTWTNGKYGGALNFDGSNDYVKVADSTTLRAGSQGWSFGGWIKVNALSSGDRGFIIRKSTSGGTPVYQISLEGNGGGSLGAGKLDFLVHDGTNQARVTTSSTYNDGKWHYIMGVWDVNNKTIYGYVDGVSVGTQQNNSMGAINPTSALEIGTDTTYSQYFNGLIDEVKIYNYARTAKQIVSDMLGSPKPVGAGGNAGQPAVGYWKFDEGAGQTVNNSGNGGSTLNGTLGANTGSSTDDPTWTNSGRFGKALSFDGGDYVQVADNSALEFSSGDFSMGAWVNRTNGSALMGKGDGGSASGTEYLLNLNGQGFWFRGAWRDSAALDVTNSIWTHIFVVFTDDNDTLKIYKNGVLADTLTSITGSYASNTTNGFYIGTQGSGLFNSFTGLIDEMKVYNYALTSDEVKTEYNKGSSLVLGTLGSNSSYQFNASNQEYCVPGDSTSCAAPIGEWNFEEGKDNTCSATADVCDTSGNANHGTWNGTGAKHWDVGKIGTAGKFNGSDDYLLTSNFFDQTSGSYTYEAWIKPAVTLTTSSANQLIFDKTTGGSNYQLGWMTDYSSKGLCMMAYKGGVGDSLVCYSTTLNAKQWYHVVFVHSQAAATVYLNGTQVATGSMGVASNSVALQIGRRAVNDQYFNGLIDQARIFNYARSAAQIAYDYNKGLPVAWWKFDECQGTTAYDNSGNANNGTITITSGGGGSQDSAGTCTNNAATAWYNGRNGKYNSSLNFDGTNDYVAVTSLNSSSYKPITYTAWVKLNSTTPPRAIVGRDYTGDGTTGMIGIYSYDSGTAATNEFAYYTGGTIFGSNYEVATGQWTHIAFTWAADNTATWYVNGVQTRTGSFSATSSSTREFRIGSRASNEHYFNGQIDDVKVFNYALTAAQVKDIYNNGAINFGPVTGSP